MARVPAASATAVVAVATRLVTFARRIVASAVIAASLGKV
jgi:hypothetical protein